MTGLPPLVTNAGMIVWKGRLFGATTALRAVSLRLEAGSLTFLEGPNGAGKTTLFNLISGFYRPEEGSIRFNGKEITRLKPYQVAGLGIDYGPNLSAIGAKLPAIKKAEDRTLFKEAMQRIGLDVASVGEAIIERAVRQRSPLAEQVTDRLIYLARRHKLRGAIDEPQRAGRATAPPAPSGRRTGSGARRCRAARRSFTSMWFPSSGRACRATTG